MVLLANPGKEFLLLVGLKICIAFDRSCLSLMSCTSGCLRAGWTEAVPPGSSCWSRHKFMVLTGAAFRCPTAPNGPWSEQSCENDPVESLSLCQDEWVDSFLMKIQIWPLIKCSICCLNRSLLFSLMRFRGWSLCGTYVIGVISHSSHAIHTK